MLSQGLEIFRVSIPPALRGKTLVQSALSERTGCAVIAIRTDAGMEITPDPRKPMPEVAELILIGTTESETRFLELYAARIGRSRGVFGS
jgi:K+/H+ antiporter YhaU regulatory subunit KhtT